MLLKKFDFDLDVKDFKKLKLEINNSVSSRGQAKSMFTSGTFSTTIAEELERSSSSNHSAGDAKLEKLSEVQVLNQSTGGSIIYQSFRLPESQRILKEI